MWGIMRPECGREIVRSNKARLWRIGREKGSKDRLWKGKQKDMGMESAGKRLAIFNMFRYVQYILISLEELQSINGYKMSVNLCSLLGADSLAYVGLGNAKAA